MFSALGEFNYMPILKWKQGEYRAIGSLRPQDRARVAPLFVMPPLGSFDHEEGRVLSAAEHIQSFGPRLFDHCGKRVAFIDASEVDDESFREALARHPLTELIERAHRAGAIACPVVGLTNTIAYRDAVARFVGWDTRLPVCVRLKASELERASIGGDLATLLGALNCPPERVVLVADFGPIQVGEPKAFAELLATRINEIPNVQRWLGLTVAFTAFPEPNRMKIKPGQHKRFARSEWSVYQELIALKTQLARMPAFGDYATEYPIFREAAGFSPTAQFRYTTAHEYIIERGTTTRKPHGYSAIYPVAEALANKSEFCGEGFSAGDKFIAGLSKRAIGHSNAPTWRWATTLHHMTLVMHDLRSMIAFESVIEETREEDQLVLI